MQKQILVLIDGNALLYRAFHAYPTLTTSKGELVNAVFGFTSMLMLTLEKLKPEYICVVFDEKGPTFRHQQFTQYKAQRKPMDDGLVMQIERTREIVRAFEMPLFAIPGYEADDIIGTIVKKNGEWKSDMREKGVVEIVIVTGDRDLLQLIGDDVVAMMPGKSFSDAVMVDVKAFQERWGVNDPKQLIDLKALMGDASDNIPGVAGIGEKTAQKLIAQYGSVEKLYQHIDEIEGKVKEKLANGAEMAVLSKQLATIDCAVPLQFDLDACSTKVFDLAKVKELFEELEFRSLAKRVEKIYAGYNPVGNTQYTMNNTQEPDRKKLINCEQAGLFEEEAVKEYNQVDEIEKFLEGQPDHVKVLDLAMVPVLNRMTEHGVMVDKAVLSELSESFALKVDQLVKNIYHDVGHEFNINSPKQLGDVLFDELNLPVIRKTKTGRSTNEEVLRELEVSHPVIEKVIQYRELFKLKSTYIDGLPKYIKEDGRIHSVFRLDVAATGRLSSVDPNLQNIPIRSTWGTEIRKAFVAPAGNVLLAMDYSQIELRILAHLAKDEGLIGIFARGEDVHRSTAAKVFNIAPDQVTKDQRRSAKTINFGLMYGMGARALAQDLKITYSQAELFIKAYFAAFPKVKAYMDSVVKFGTEQGYVETILGRRRFLPELQSADQRLRSAGVRMAINMPCQGTQAEMIKQAMVKIDSIINSSVIPAQAGIHSGNNNQDPNTNNQIIINNQSSNKEICMILQIHDELIFEVREDAVDKWIPIIRKEMVEAIPLSVPIEVGVNIGKSWGEMKEVESV